MRRCFDFVLFVQGNDGGDAGGAGPGGGMQAYLQDLVGQGGAGGGGAPAGSGAGEERLIPLPPHPPERDSKCPILCHETASEIKTRILFAYNTNA